MENTVWILLQYSVGIASTRYNTFPQYLNDLYFPKTAQMLAKIISVLKTRLEILIHYLKICQWHG